MAQYLMGTLNETRQISQNHPTCFCIVSYLGHTKIGSDSCEGVRCYFWKRSAHVNILSEVLQVQNRSADSSLPNLIRVGCCVLAS